MPARDNRSTARLLALPPAVLDGSDRLSRRYQCRTANWSAFTSPRRRSRTLVEQALELAIPWVRSGRSEQIQQAFPAWPPTTAAVRGLGRQQVKALIEQLSRRAEP